MIHHAVIIGDSDSNLAAYTPEVPGRIVTGKTVEESTTLMTEALELLIQLLRE
jgi:predicted RNase H-like HicB family nuclease